MQHLGRLSTSSSPPAARHNSLFKLSVTDRALLNCTNRQMHIPTYLSQKMIFMRLRAAKSLSNTQTNNNKANNEEVTRNVHKWVFEQNFELGF